MKTSAVFLQASCVLFFYFLSPITSIAKTSNSQLKLSSNSGQEETFSRPNLSSRQEELSSKLNFGQEETSSWLISNSKQDSRLGVDSLQTSISGASHAFVAATPTDGPLKIYSDSIDVQLGQSFFLDLKMDNVRADFKIIAIQFELLFDTAKVLWLDSIRVGDLAETAICELKANESGRLEFALIYDQYFVGSGSLVSFQFYAKDLGDWTPQLTSFLLNTDSIQEIQLKPVNIFSFYGDVDDNGSIQAYDAALVLHYSVGLDPLSDDPSPWEAWRFVAADVNSDNSLSAYDAALILQKAVHKTQTFPSQEAFSQNTKSTTEPQLSHSIATAIPAANAQLLDSISAQIINPEPQLSHSITTEIKIVKPTFLDSHQNDLVSPDLLLNSPARTATTSLDIMNNYPLEIETSLPDPQYANLIPDVRVSVESNYLVFRSMGEVIGLNVDIPIREFDFGSVVFARNFMKIENRTLDKLKIGLALDEALEQDAELFRVEFSPIDSETRINTTKSNDFDSPTKANPFKIELDLIVNQYFKKVVLDLNTSTEQTIVRDFLLDRTTNQIQLLNQNIQSCTLTDMNGRKCIYSAEQKIHLSGMPKGMFVLCVQYRNKQTKNYKMIL